MMSNMNILISIILITILTIFLHITILISIVLILDITIIHIIHG